MKNLFIGLLMLAGSASFANTPIIDNDIAESKSEIIVDKQIVSDNKKSVENTEETICTISCQMVVGDVIYNASAGNWFSTCSGAASRCEAKLEALLQ